VLVLQLLSKLRVSWTDPLQQIKLGKASWSLFFRKQLNINFLQQIHVSILSPQTSHLTSFEVSEHQILTEKCIF